MYPLPAFRRSRRRAGQIGLHAALTQAWRAAVGCATLSALCCALVAAPAAAFDPDDPPSLGDMVGEQIRRLGAGLDQRNALKLERQQTIARLERELVACGRCAERARIEKALAHWRETDRVVAQAEHAALAHMGLGQYRSIEDLGMAILRDMAPASQRIEAERARQEDLAYIREMVKHQCEAKHRPPRPTACATVALPRARQQEQAAAVAACVRENDPLRLYANDQVQRQLCQQQADAAGCVARHGIVAQARAYQQAAAQSDMQAYAAQRDARNAQAAAEGQAWRDRRDARQAARKLSAEERRAQAAADREARQTEIAERKRQRAECQGG